MKVKLIAPCLFGVESVLKDEIKKLGYVVTKVDNGRVSFEGDMGALCRSNIFLRTAERVLLEIGTFKAITFEELFDKTKELPWENYLPKNAKFWVKKASSIKSKLFSASDIQSLVKKAIVDRLSKKYNINWFPEEGNEFPIRVFILKDKVTIALDTSGEALHKRGYRKYTSKAPLSETLAAAIVKLTPWNKERLLIDPFCGSGTIPIEAAMIGANIAPGLNREFISEDWTNIINKKMWINAVDEAHDLINDDYKFFIQGYDIDEQILKGARNNAELAGVDHLIHFQKRDVRELSSSKNYGFIITNPPYGERIGTKETIESLYKDMSKTFKKLETWSFFIITAVERFDEIYFKKNASKKRKLYNGMLKTELYQFFGPKPNKLVKNE